MSVNFYSSSGACQRISEQLKIVFPKNTLLYMEARGCFGAPFQRDSAGRRLLSEGDIKRVCQYLEGRKAAQGAIE